MTTSWQARFDAEHYVPITTHDTDSGILGWEKMPTVRARLAMFRATAQMSYLDLAAADVATVIAIAKAASMRPGTLPGPGWQNVSDTTNGLPTAFAVHDGLICAAIADFVRTVRGSQLAVSYAQQANAALAFLTGMARRWDAFLWYDWLSGRGALMMPKWCAYGGVPPGWTLPLNMSNQWAQFQAIYGYITGDATSLWMASTIAKTTAALMVPAALPIWPYKKTLRWLGRDGCNWAGIGSPPATDTSHACEDIGLACELPSLFNMQGLANRLKATVVGADGTMHEYINGDDVETAPWHFSHWPRLYAFDKGVGPQIGLCLAKLFDPLGIAQCAEVGIPPV